MKSAAKTNRTKKSLTLKDLKKQVDIAVIENKSFVRAFSPLPKWACEITEDHPIFIGDFEIRIRKM